MNYNLYAGAFLGTVFVLMTVGLAGDAIFYSEAPEEPGFAIAVLDEPSGPAEPEEEGLQPITALLASADISAGPSVFRKCQSCHLIESGGDHRTGPNLWGMVGRQAGTKDGFGYSAAMVAYSEEGNIWDFEALNRYLYAPADYIDGTAMRFAGLPREDERRDLIAWMASQGDEPVPFDAFETAAAPAEEAPMEDDAAPAEEAAPADDLTADDAAPADDMAPADEKAAPAEEEAPADDQDAAPADTEAAPAEDTETPAE